MSSQNVGPVSGAREVTTLVNLDVENEQGGTRGDGQTCLARLNFQARMGTGKITFCSVQLTTSRIGNDTRLLPSVLNVLTTHPHAWSI